MRLAVGLAALACMAAAPARAAAAPCEAARPTAKQAWRAELGGRADLAGRPGGATRARVSPAAAGALLVLDARHDREGRCWLQVRLPERPNRAKAWLDARRVTVRRTTWRIDVRLRARTVTLYRAGKLERRYRAVIGAPSTPTPQGLFALVDAYHNDPGDFLGRWIVTLTAHSDVLQRYDGGNGRVALHGRGGASLLDPLGSAASHGCVRLSNDAIAGLVRRIGLQALPGTPVRIRA